MPSIVAANLWESNSLHLCNLTFCTDSGGSDSRIFFHFVVPDSISRKTVSCTFINLRFTYALNVLGERINIRHEGISSRGFEECGGTS